MSEPVNVADYAALAAERERGTAFGWYNLVVGVAAIPGGLLFGGLWHYYGAAASFLGAGALALLAALLLRGWAWPRAA